MVRPVDAAQLEVEILAQYRSTDDVGVTVIAFMPDQHERGIRLALNHLQRVSQAAIYGAIAGNRLFHGQSSALRGIGQDNAPASPRRTSAKPLERGLENLDRPNHRCIAR